MEELKTGLKYSAKRGVITVVSIGSSSYEIGVGANYTIELSLGHVSSLTILSGLVLKIPTAYQGRVIGCQPSPCSIGVNSITFSQLTSSLISNQLTIELDVTNPLTIGLSSSFQFYSL